MSMSKSPEDLTLEEINEQLAIYQRLYYHKKKQETQYWEAKKKSAEQRIKREILNKILEENDKGIKLDNLNLEELDTIKKKKKGRKIIPAEKAVLLKTVPEDKLEEDASSEASRCIRDEEEKKPTKTPKTKKAKKEEQ